MNTALLRLATQRARGYRAWPSPTHKGGTVKLMVPRLGMWPHPPLQGWHLSYSVEGGKRGVNTTMHKKLARAIFADMRDGTNLTRYDTPL